MVIICAWCKKTLGEKEPFDNPSTTHGICTECYKKVLDEEKGFLTKNLST